MPLRRRIEQWTLRQRLLALFVTAVGAVVLSGGLATFAVVRLDTSVRTTVDRSDPARVAAEDFFNGLLNQETAVRGYALSRQATFLQPYRSGRQEETAAYRRLEGYLAGQRGLEAALSGTLAAARNWQVNSAAPTIAAAAKGAVKESVIAGGKHRFDAFRTQFARLVSALDAEHTAADQELAGSGVILIVLLGVGAFVLLAVLALGWVALRDWVTTPLTRIADQSRIVAGGELDHVIEGVGPPELRALAADVDAMRLRIVADLSAAESARRRLDEQADSLKRSNADLEQFAYVASHDLQEPLRKIASFSELVQRRYAGELDERGREYLSYVADGARRLQELIHDILELSRVGRAMSTLVPVDSAAAAREAVGNLVEQITSTGAAVHLGPLPRVLGDRLLLVALLQNIVGNAIKFKSDAPPVVTVSAEREGDLWRFSVSDNGLGIPPEHAERVFTMFQRLHRRDEFEGTGIGLALCKRIVAHFGGRIWLGPGPGGEGTTVSWTIAGTDGTTALT